MPRQLRCPICQKAVAPRKENSAFPFCSPRCRAIDLGKWLGEEYSLPEPAGPERDDEAPASTADPDSPDA